MKDEKDLHLECKSKKKVSISIIAHIDHGKSTFCDALIRECYGDIIKSNKNPSLDDHEIEKSRGVTIRNHFIRLNYRDVEINIIDTPGHCDFIQYSLVGIKSSDLSMLIIDVTQGIQAQTIFLLNEMRDIKKNCIVIMNKIDCAAQCDIEKAIEIIKSRILPLDIIYVSAKYHKNIDSCLDSICNHSELTTCKSEDIYSFLILDCIGSKFYGTTLFIKVTYGYISINQSIDIKGQKVKIRKIQVKSISIANVNRGYKNSFYYIQVNEKINFQSSLIGNYISNNKTYSNKKIVASINPVLYCDVVSKQNTHDATYKVLSYLAMSDQSIQLTGFNSKIYGRVYRCGFLGSLHKEVFFEKAYMENSNINIDILDSMPQYLDKDNVLIINYDLNKIDKNYKSYLNSLRSMYVEISIQIIYEYYSYLLSFIKQYTFTLKIIKEIKSHESIILMCTMSSQELTKKSLDMMKGMTKGYANVMIRDKYYRSSSLSLIEIIVNKIRIGELTVICESKLYNAYKQSIIDMMSKKIKKFQYELNIQISLDKKIIQTYSIKPCYKDVTAKCYGGDVTRKNKLLQKQQAGKNKLMNIEKDSIHKRIMLMINSD